MPAVTPMSQPMVGGLTPAVSVKEHRTDSIVKNVRSILEAWRIMGFRESGYSLEPTIEYHDKCVKALGGKVLAFYKYKLAAWVAAALDERMPSIPKGLEEDNPTVLLGGRAWMWQKLVRRTNPGRWQQIIASVMNIKRMLERPTDKDLKEALTKAFQALTRPNNKAPSPTIEEPWKKGQYDWADVTEEELLDEKEAELEEEVRRTTREIMQDAEFTWKDCLEPFFPSTKANYLATRSKGGAVGHIMQDVILNGLREMDAELVRLEYAGVKSTEWAELAFNQEGWRALRVEVDSSRLQEKFRILFERMIERAKGEEKVVTLVALAEALKVRVISKGPVFTYTVLKPLQKWLWKKLVTHNSGTFNLIGEEITSDYLDKQIGNLKDYEKFLSGDYSAATDNVKSRFSKAVTDEISKSIKIKELRSLFEDALVGHWIENPDKPGEMSRQTWGQLMGSIVSFPVLCVINAAICRKAREVTVGRSLRLQDAGVAINGDDTVFRADERGREKWEELAEISGMAPSIGKVFYSSTFLNMNSAQFLRIPETYRPSELKVEGSRLKLGPAHFLEQVPRINFGLAVGLGRSTGGKVEKARVSNWGTVNSISANAHTLMRECAPEDRDTVFKFYLNRNWKILKKTRLPWFLPEHLGGLGLPNVAGYQPTQLDLRQAAAFYKYGKLPTKRPEGISWKVWDYSQKRLKAMKKTESLSIALADEMVVSRDNHHPSNINENRVLAELCVEALFTQPFSKVYREEREENLTLRRVERAVDRVKKHMANVEPFTLENIPKVPVSGEKALGYNSRDAISHATYGYTQTLFTE
jgi:hypothetical protein